MKRVLHTCPWPGEVCRGCKSKNKPKLTIDRSELMTSKLEGTNGFNVWALSTRISDAVEDKHGTHNRWHCRFMAAKEHDEELAQAIEDFVILTITEQPQAPYFTEFIRWRPFKGIEEDQRLHMLFIGDASLLPYFTNKRIK